jgi:hypothetical protein
LKTVAKSQAHGENAAASSVSGLGDAAYIFTRDNGRTNASGVATTSLMILDGSKLIDLIGELTVPQVEAVAHYVLAY